MGMMDGWHTYWTDLSAYTPENRVPQEERCFKCDRLRIHDVGTDDECRAGLCGDCCKQLREVAA